MFTQYYRVKSEGKRIYVPVDCATNVFVFDTEEDMNVWIDTMVPLADRLNAVAAVPAPPWRAAFHAIPGDYKISQITTTAATPNRTIYARTYSSPQVDNDGYPYMAWAILGHNLDGSATGVGLYAP